MLIGNYTVLAKSPCRWRSGGATGLGMDRSNWNTSGAARGIFSGWADPKSAYPNGYPPGAALIVAQKSGGMGAACGQIVGSASVASLNLAGGLNADVSLDGAGDIPAAALALVVSAVAALAGTGATVADIKGVLEAAANVPGGGDLAGSLGALAFLLAAIQGDGDTEGALNARGALSSDIVVTGDLLTTANVADAILDALNGVEQGLTVREAMRLISAAVAGKVSGGGTSTVTFRSAQADDKDRIVATVDSSGNRSAITTDLT